MLKNLAHVVDEDSKEEWTKVKVFLETIYHVQW